MQMKQLRLFEKCPACQGFIPHDVVWDTYTQEEIEVETNYGPMDNSWDFWRVIVYYDKCPLCGKGLVTKVFPIKKIAHADWGSNYRMILEDIKRGFYGTTILFDRYAHRR